MNTSGNDDSVTGGRRIVITVLGVFVVAYSLAMLPHYYDWKPDWLRILSVGGILRLNSLIGYLTAAIGVMASLRRPGPVTFLCGLLTSLLGFLTLAEYVFYSDFGVSDLFGGRSLLGILPYPERMPAIAALNFALIGCCLCLLTVRLRDLHLRSFMASMLGYLAIAQIFFAAVSAFLESYLLQGWLSLPRLGIHGILVIVAFSLALGLRLAVLPVGAVNQRQMLMPFGFSLAISIGAASLWLAFLISEERSIYSDTRNHAQVLSEQIQTALEERTGSLERSLDGRQINDFQSLDKHIAALRNKDVQMKGIIGSAFVDPAFRVKQAEPADDFQEFLAGWLLEARNRVRMDQVRSFRRSQIIASFEFGENRAGFLVIVPQFSAKGYEGSVVVLLNSQSFFSKLTAGNGYFDRVLLPSGEQLFANTHFARFETTPWEVTELIRFRDLRLNIVSSPRPATIRKQGTPLPVLTLLAGYAIAILVGSLLYLSYTTREAERRAWGALTWQKAITDGSDFSIISTDALGVVQSFNPAAERLLGYRAGEVCGRQIPMLWFDPLDVQSVAHSLSDELGIPVEPGFQAFVGRVRRVGVDRREWVVIDKQGRRISVMISMHAIRDEKGVISGYVAIIQDLTHEKDQEKRIADQQSKIISSSRLASLGEMAGGIAHEINNPLSIISCRAQQVTSLLEMGQADSHKINKYMLSIEETVLRIAKIIKGLRSFARESAGDPFVMVDINSIIGDTLSFCAARFEHHDVALRLAGLEIKQVVECRPFQISQVLLNLLNNAFDAVQNQKEKWVELALLGEKDGIRITVTDSGAGIAEPIREKIMEPFFTTKPIGKGTGLGLSISRGIAADHGGVLEYDASYAYTRFVLWLPRVQEYSGDDMWAMHAQQSGPIM